MNSTIKSRKFRGGAYATAVSFLVILVLIAVNLISGSIFTKKDVTSNRRYSIADETRAFVEKLETPVALYYITSEGEEDLIIKTGAELIAEASDKITLTVKDPVQYPQFVYRYNGMEDITNNSIIVVNTEDPDRYCYIDSEKMKIYYLDTQALTNQLVGYDAEVEIVKAIVEVTQEKKGTVYVTNNHEEWLTTGQYNDPKNMVTETFSDLMNLNAYKIKHIDLSTLAAVPDDCDILLIGAPTYDLSDGEVKVIEDYITGGGTVFLSILTGSDVFKNLQSLLGYYGIRVGSGLLCEGDSSRTVGDNPSYLLTAHDDKNAVWMRTAPLYTDSSVRSTAAIKRVYETTKDAYIKQTDAGYEKTPDDESGQFPLLVKVEDSFEGKVGTLYVCGSAYFLMDSFMTGSSARANRDIFVDSLNAQLGAAADPIAIPDTSALEEALQMTTRQRNNVALASFLLPVLILFVGVVVILRRRVERIETKEKTEE
ncbi:MAG: Gldg family protein [Lachnospiraceae bacterium]|nr:Gldg family protein [Lachnospiraceae bacterium]